jgi:sporulation-control protein
MVFKRLLGSLGVGGPTVDTVLTGSGTPGGVVRGDVHVQGGEADFDIQQITLELVATPQAGPGAPQGPGTSAKPVVFGREVVGGGFPIAAGERRSLPFSLPLPWETPITELYGQPLGLELGVRTELAIASARDSGDLDPLTVSALPAHETVLESLGQLGFEFAATVLLPGQASGVFQQQLPFHQELMLRAPARYTDRIQGLDVTLLATAQGLDVVLEADKHLAGAMPGPAVRHTVPHRETAKRDWQSEITSWVEELLEQRQAALAQLQQAQFQQMPQMPPGQMQQGGMQPGQMGAGPMGQMQPGQQPKGGGAGRAVAAGAAGLGAGLLGGMMLNQAFGGGSEGEEEDMAADGGGDDGGE